MPARSHRFDSFLGRVNADHLKPMARLWGGRSQLRKDECLATILAGLRDPDRVRAAIASLTPFERNALALIKQMGGDTDAGGLAIALRASGVQLPPSRSPYYDNANALIEPLIRRGLLLSGYAYDPGHLYSSSPGECGVFSDDRLLEYISPPEFRSLRIEPTIPPPSSHYRRPPTVVLDVVGLLQAVENIGGLPLTKSGEVQVNAMRKLARAMGWKENTFKVDGLPFPDPDLAFVNALRHSALLIQQDDSLRPREPAGQFATRPYVEQVGQFLYGFLQADAWSEWPKHPWYDGQGKHQTHGRFALTVALGCLPVEADGFFALDDLDRALYERIGEHFSLDYVPSRPYAFHKTPEEIRKEENEWRNKLRTAWLKRERLWIERALSTWLYYLGLVELGMENGTLVSVRLTDLGRAVLHPELDITFDQSSNGGQAAWVVQPNFDVIVYLDRATPKQLAFMERHAERVQAQQHTVHYRLTRASVYRGLESGATLDDLLSELQNSAGANLPQNIVVEIREWAALRERITLRRQARLLEFPDARSRQAALQEKIQGVLIGERFILLDSPDAPIEVKARVDYARPLPTCLSITEDGVIKLTHAAPDLVIEPRLDRWAERRSRDTWQLTQVSVTSALKAGARLGDLLNLLKGRLTRPLPPLLEIALRAWAGDRPNVEMETVVILRCDEPDVFQAIANSKKIKPYLRGTLAPDLIVVESQHVEALKERLAWIGLKLFDTLLIERDDT